MSEPSMNPFDENLFEESRKDYLEAKFPGDLGEMAEQAWTEPEKITQKVNWTGRWISIALAASLLFVLLYWAGLFEASNGTTGNRKVVAAPNSSGKAGRSSLVPGSGTISFAKLRPIKKYSSRKQVLAPSFAMFGPSKSKKETNEASKRKPILFPAQKTAAFGRPVYWNSVAKSTTAITDTELKKLKQSRKRLLRIQNRSRPSFGFKSKLRS